MSGSLSERQAYSRQREQQVQRHGDAPSHHMCWCEADQCGRRRECGGGNCGEMGPDGRGKVVLTMPRDPDVVTELQST